jgi:hypothetical protein
MSRRLRLATPADVPTLEILIARSARGLSAPFYSAEQVESNCGTSSASTRNSSPTGPIS